LGTGPASVKLERRAEGSGERPIEVTHLISGDLWAGAEVATFHLVRALSRRRDVSVSVVALNEGTLVARLRGCGVRVAVVPESQHGFVGLWRRVRRELSCCDLVHAHRYKEDLLAALSGRPWVATQHGRPEPAEGAARWRMGIYLALNRLALRSRARRVIAVSGEIEDWLRGHVPGPRVARIWNGIADPLAGREPSAWRDRPLCVGVLGRLAPVKGYELAVETVARCPGVELEIVGDGPERPRLEALARGAGAAERIRFLGHLEEPLGRVARWRAMLVTSLHEGNPIGVLEAMALGTPVLSCPLRGIEEILAGRGGRVVKAGREPAEWARALQGLLDDGAEGDRLSREARQRFLESFLDERCAEGTAALYREALPSPGGG